MSNERMSYLEMAKQDAVNAVNAQTSTAWKEGDDLINAAYLWVAERYEHLPDPRPAVVGQEWSQLEAAIDAAYEASDMETLRGAVRAWAKFAVEAFKRGRVSA